MKRKDATKITKGIKANSTGIKQEVLDNVIDVIENFCDGKCDKCDYVCPYEKEDK